ncbi:hypothetical protein SK128_015400 [Halocaridina rubra]|uniref:Uncharacterized protein n=1 Tax=Halocaridina rubra TaxID=373956 RepID=A0AAN9A7P0_HALRR
METFSTKMLFMYFVTMNLLLLPASGLELPDLACDTLKDCQEPPWTAPFPSCHENKCICARGTCLIYTTSDPDFLFYCGICGSLGSQCNDSVICDVQKCGNDNFCHCNQGRVYRELCVIYEPIPTSISSVVLIVVLAILLIFLKLFKSRHTIREYWCNRCSDNNSDQSTVVGFNPNSYGKSAAYTITNSAFMVNSEDSDIEWALELSRRMSQGSEEWLSLEIHNHSSSSSSNSRNQTSSRSRRPYHSRILEALSEPGPSGTQNNRTSQRRSIESSSSSTSSSFRQRISQCSSTSSSIPTNFSSRNSPRARRVMFSSGSEIRRASHLAQSNIQHANPVSRSSSSSTSSMTSMSSSSDISGRSNRTSGSYDASESSNGISSLSSSSEL